jgi:hypothetical protein
VEAVFAEAVVEVEDLEAVRLGGRPALDGGRIVRDGMPGERTRVGGEEGGVMRARVPRFGEAAGEFRETFGIVARRGRRVLHTSTSVAGRWTMCNQVGRQAHTQGGWILNVIGNSTHAAAR